MKNILNGLKLSWNMLTIIPLFKIHQFNKGINGYSAMFYPVIGIIIGLILYNINIFLSPYLPQNHLHMVIFALWVLFTGALHLDGFSDTIDGLYVSQEKALSVMKDSHIGGMGMIFSGVFLLLKASSIVVLDNLFFLVFILMLSRASVVFSIYFFPYISSGIGVLIKQELQWFHIVFVVIVSLIVSIMLHQVLIAILGIIFSIIVTYFFYKRYGGCNGDIYGFIIELTELFLLQCLIIQS